MATFWTQEMDERLVELWEQYISFFAVSYPFLSALQQECPEVTLQFTGGSLEFSGKYCSICIKNGFHIITDALKYRTQR